MKLRLNPLRVAGEMEVSLETDAAGNITGVELLPSSTVRGFETLLKGQEISFAVPAVMRICGICHAAHGTAICEAIEDVFGIRPPRMGLLLREACVLTNRIQSHMMQFYLVLQDLVPQDALPALQGACLRGLELASTLLQTICGTATHPSLLTVGGLARGVTDKGRDKAQEVLEELEGLISVFSRDFQEASAGSPNRGLLEGVKLPERYLATDLFYGNPTRVEPGSVIPLEPEGNAIPLSYGEGPVEVGPRARLWAFLGFRDPSLMGLQLARLQELTLSTGRIGEILRAYDPQLPCHAGELPLKAGRGIGVVEAPRGTLIHLLELDDEGRIVQLKIFTPTQFNFAYLKVALRGLPARLAEVALRIYDPCIPCAVH